MSAPQPHGADHATRRGLLDSDPDGAQIYTWPTAPPTGDWRYIVDDFGIRYRHRGWWPFRRGGPAEERTAIDQARRGAARRGVSLESAEGCGWTSLRVAPDTGYGAGGQNYVTLWPDLSCPWRVAADLHLYVRPQGMCAVVIGCGVQIDLRTMTAALHRWRPHWPTELHEQATEKAAKLAALLTEHVTRRDAGKRIVVTAHQQWQSRSGPDHAPAHPRP